MVCAPAVCDVTVKRLRVAVPGQSLATRRTSARELRNCFKLLTKALSHPSPRRSRQLTTDHSPNHLPCDKRSIR